MNFKNKIRAVTPLICQLSTVKNVKQCQGGSLKFRWIFSTNLVV